MLPWKLPSTSARNTKNVQTASNTTIASARLNAPNVRHVTNRQAATMALIQLLMTTIIDSHHSDANRFFVVMLMTPTIYSSRLISRRDFIYQLIVDSSPCFPPQYQYPLFHRSAYLPNRRKQFGTCVCLHSKNYDCSISTFGLLYTRPYKSHTPDTPHASHTVPPQPAKALYSPPKSNHKRYSHTSNYMIPSTHI